MSKRKLGSLQPGNTGPPPQEDPGERIRLNISLHREGPKCLYKSSEYPEKFPNNMQLFLVLCKNMDTT